MTDKETYDDAFLTDTTSEKEGCTESDERLKEMWKEMNQRISKLEHQIGEEGRRVSDSNLRTTQQDLAKRYKRFMAVGACMAILWPGVLLMPDFMEVADYTWHIVAAILFLVYFLTAAIFDGYLWNGVLSLKMDSMPVDTIVKEVGRLKRIHHRSMMLLIPMAIVTLGYFISPFLHDKYLMGGVTVGGVCGMLVGLKAYFRMMADYRRMMADYL